MESSSLHIYVTLPVELYSAYQNGKSILFEGAQGISLDVDHGIYPFTTSSNTATGHISTGTGVTFRTINRVIGVVKGYLSRVGGESITI